VPAATYTVLATKAGYLSARKTGVVVPAGGSVNIGNVMMLGGDCDNSGNIDIVDLVIVGVVYGQTPPVDPRADINGDGSCNLVDLVLVGSNYGKVGPTDWVALAAASAPEGIAPKLTIGPSFRIAPPGGTVTLDIVASGVADLYGGEFELHYDPAALEIVDANPNADGIQVAVGEVFAGSDGYVALNEVDAAAGKVRFAATLLDPAPAIQGNAVLAKVTFKGLKTGPTMLQFGNAQLVTSQAIALDVQARNGSLWFGSIHQINPAVESKLKRLSE